VGDGPVPIGLSCIDGYHFLDNVHRTLKSYNGKVAWSGSKKGLEEKARLRRKAKELALRTKAPYSNRGY
jgi:hypothetical protein